MQTYDASLLEVLYPVQVLTAVFGDACSVLCCEQSQTSKYKSVDL